MNIPETTKQKLLTLIAEGRKLEAVKFVKEEFRLSLKSAVRLVEVLQKESPAGEKTKPFRNGVFSGPDKVISLLSTVFLCIAILLLAIGATIGYNTNQQLNRSLSLKGKVVGFDHKTGDTSIPIVEFIQNGKVRRVTGRVGSSPPAYDIGEELTVYIFDDGEEEVLLDGIFELWVGPLILGFIGSIFLFIGGGMYAINRKM